VAPQVRQIHVEPLAPGDVVAFAQCVALDVTVFPSPSIPTFDALRGMPPMWIARLRRGDAVCGFVVARRRGRLLEILGVAVAPARRRRGVGRALLRAVIAAARSRRISEVTLQVSTDNRAAVALYLAEGFERVRRLPGFYRHHGLGDGGDAWAMHLSLRPASN
jgi:ribosomal-protein-alanine N-acetyltransferase